MMNIFPFLFPFSYFFYFFLPLFFFTYVILLTGSSQYTYGDCSASLLAGEGITCRAKMTYFVLGKSTTVDGHVTSTSCDPDVVCNTFADIYKNARCTEGYCCRDGKLCSGQSSSISRGVHFVLILSTLVATFSTYM